MNQIGKYVSGILLYPPRRRFIISAIAAAYFLRSSKAESASLTGIDVLDTPSIPVKAPDRALMVAVTKVEDRLVAVGEHGVIIYSDDNGQTWTQGSVPVNVTLTCVTFATKELGWAAGHFGVVLATVDGGQTWKLQLDGIQANQLTLAAAQDPALATSSLPGAPLALVRANHFVTDGPDLPFLSLLSLGPEKVIAFGAYRMTMLTEDGGKTWTDWSLHIYDKFSHNIYDAAKIGQAFYLVGEEGMVFRSTDACDNFLPLTAAGDATLFGILGAKDGALLVFGVAGTALRSTDSGNTWNAVALATQDDVTTGRVLNSGTILLAGATGMLLKSTDNGTSFAVIPGIGPNSIFDMEEAPNGALIVAGATGVSAISSNVL